MKIARLAVIPILALGAMAGFAAGADQSTVPAASGPLWEFDTGG